MDMLETIKTRKSIRKFKGTPVKDEFINNILEAGRWAPSGMNNQPWRFAVITDISLREKISKLTHYSKIVRSAPVLIAVFLDNNEGYNRTKDIQAMGACIQNMLLEAHSLGLGAVWLGEIIKSDESIRGLLGLGDDLELMAVIALGYPDEKPKSSRKKLAELIVFKK